MQRFTESFVMCLVLKHVLRIKELPNLDKTGKINNVIKAYITFLFTSCPFFFLFFFFLATPVHGQVPGPGSEPGPQQ